MESQAGALDQPVSFREPPVHEVVLSVQFAASVITDDVALAHFWPRVRDRFPKLERQPPILSAREDFAFPPQPIAIPLPIGDVPPQRYWFISEAGTELIQIQPNRLLTNWRQVEGTETYPRYPHVRELFTDVYRQLTEALEQAGKDQAVPEWCEVQYTNEIPATAESGHGHMELGRVFEFIARERAVGVLPEPEDTQLNERYVLRRNGKPYGRLYLNAAPALRPRDQQPVYVVNLLVRGRPASEDLDGVLGLFDEAHGTLVRAFREVMTEEMRERWGLMEEESSGSSSG